MKKKLVLYYSFDQRTKAAAHSKAKELKADEVVEIKEVKKRSKFNIIIPGIFEAMQLKKSEIEPLDTDLNEYGTIIIFMPLWGNYPAPVMNSIIELIPKGKDIELYMTSPNGNSLKSADNTSNEIQKRGSLVTKYVDLVV